MSAETLQDSSSADPCMFVPAGGLITDMQKLPRKEYVFFSQLAVLFVVIVAAIINISLNNGQQEVWLVLLSTGVGALLPNPRLGKRKSPGALHGQVTPTPAATP